MDPKPIMVLPGTPTKGALKRKRGISFSPAPVVHEFDTASPSTRRLELRWKGVENVDDDVIIHELRARGKLKENKGKAGRVNSLQKRFLKNCWVKEMKEMLKSRGVTPSGDYEELTERLDLINKLRRRAQLRVSGISPVPIKMTWRQLTNELKARKINVNEESVKEMVEALESALEKESEDRVYGAGYEFGRRHLSALNMIDAEEMNSTQLRAAIKARGRPCPRKKQEQRDLLGKLLEEELETSLREAVNVELQEELERRGVDFKEFLGPAKIPAPDKDSGPQTRSKSRKKQCGASPGQSRSPQEDMKKLFDRLYESGLWKEDYDIADNKNNCGVM